MDSRQLKSLRIFIYLLATVFFSGTVYSSGMMVADQLCANHTVGVESHNLEDREMNQHDHHKHHEHEAEQKQSTSQSVAFR